jgi:hypothetical protein
MSYKLRFVSIVRKINFLLPIFVLIVTVAINELLLYSVEMKARQEARSNLQVITTALPKLEESGLSTKESLDIIAKSVRTFGETGDTHAYNIVHLNEWGKAIIFFDASQDCTTLKPLTLGEVVRLFADPKSAEIAFKYILNSRASNETTRLSWLFDDATEWLEWKSIDDKNMGNIVIVAGVQSDEAMQGFTLVSIMIQISGLSALALILVLNMQIATRERRRINV